MFFKKKKKQEPKIWDKLNEKMAAAQENGERIFYCPIYGSEVEDMKMWTESCGVLYLADHITDNIVVYKFWGYTVD